MALAGLSCPAGEAVVGFDTSGELVCVPFTPVCELDDEDQTLANDTRETASPLGTINDTETIVIDGTLCPDTADWFSIHVEDTFSGDITDTTLHCFSERGPVALTMVNTTTDVEVTDNGTGDTDMSLESLSPETAFWNSGGSDDSTDALIAITDPDPATTPYITYQCRFGEP